MMLVYYLSLLCAKQSVPKGTVTNCRPQAEPLKTVMTSDGGDVQLGKQYRTTAIMLHAIARILE
jgi:hypothetical protein